MSSDLPVRSNSLCVVPSHQIIIVPGFGYNFNSLVGKHNELADAFATIFSTARKFRLITVLQVWFPLLRKFVSTAASLAFSYTPTHCHFGTAPE
jgi:hypothetical protein